MDAFALIRATGELAAVFLFIAGLLALGIACGA